MRLTLRTLLAYLDDILEPRDAAEISRKIEESKFATDLIHRIRNSMRRLRLGSPPVDARGTGLDANTVSEYLDNIKTLRPEQVADFEKVCLESDVHLAEVASCHQILALVLGQPAEVDEATRARMYRLGSGDASAPQTAQTVVLPAEPAEAAVPALLDAGDRTDAPLAEPVVSRSTRAKPDYRQVGKKLPLQSLAITLVCGFLLAVVALRAMGPFGPTHPVWRLLSGGDETAVAETSEGDQATEEPVTEQPIPSSGAESDREKTIAEPSSDPVPVIPRSDAEASAASVSEETSATVAPDAPTAASLPPAVAPTAEPTSIPAVPPAPPETEMSAGEGSREAAPAEDGESDTPPPPPERVSVGRYISEEQVLAQFDSETGSWFRLATDEPLSRGSTLLSLPTYRPQILLAPNAKITFSGETRATAFEPFNSEMATLQLEYGRAVVVSADSNPAQVHLALPEREGVAQLSDPDSILAVDVIPFVPEGSDPLATPRRVAIRLIAASGPISWIEGSDEQALTAGEAILLAEGGSASREPAGLLPSWIEGKEMATIESLASQELRRHLTVDRPLNLSLLERTEFRREEVRALAARSLCSLDVFEPTIIALNDEAQRSYWASHFEALRKALQRDSESAAKVLADLEKNFGDEGRSLFRMLWGYAPEQLESGADRELVRNLEHPAMIGRVLAIENLRRITDKTMLFNAWQPPSQEKRQILKWQKAAEEGTIRYAKPAATPSDAKPEPPLPDGSPARPPRAAS